MSRNWTQRCCVQEGSTTSFTWEMQAISKKWSSIAGFSRMHRNEKHGSLSKLLDPQKRWLSFKACCWLCSREKVAWIKWQRITEFWCKALAGGDRSRLLRGRATSVRGRQKCRYRVAHSPAMRCTTSSPVVMCDGSFEGRRFESCHSLRAV